MPHHQHPHRARPDHRLRAWTAATISAALALAISGAVAITGIGAGGAAAPAAHSAPMRAAASQPAPVDPAPAPAPDSPAPDSAIRADHGAWNVPAEPGTPEPGPDPDPTSPVRQHHPAERGEHDVFTVHVVAVGDQSDIDACIGAIDYLGSGVIGEHNYCGGSRYHQLDVGDAVRLTGVMGGDWVVIDIYDSRAGSTDYVHGAVHLQTSLGGGAVRLWQLEPR